MLGKRRVALAVLVGLAVGLSFPIVSAAGWALLNAGAVACAEQLVNGGFETGADGWQQSSIGGHELISDFYPHSGRWGAYLGGANNADDILSQQATLPATAISVTLTAWWAIATEEAGIGFDRLTASLHGPDGALLAELWTIDSSAMVNTWDQIETDLTAYRGQTVRIQFRATTDDSNLTDFYLDDLSLWVCAPDFAVYLPLIVR